MDLDCEMVDEVECWDETVAMGEDMDVVEQSMMDRIVDGVESWMVRMVALVMVELQVGWDDGEVMVADHLEQHTMLLPDGQEGAVAVLVVSY